MAPKQVQFTSVQFDDEEEEQEAALAASVNKYLKNESAESRAFSAMKDDGSVSSSRSTDNGVAPDLTQIGSSQTYSLAMARDKQRSDEFIDLDALDIVRSQDDSAVEDVSVELDRAASEAGSSLKKGMKDAFKGLGKLVKRARKRRPGIHVPLTERNVFYIRHSLGTSPLDSLCRLGVINQTLKLGPCRGVAEYIPRRGCWVRQETQRPLNGVMMHRVFSRTNKIRTGIPGACVYVMGELSFARLEVTNNTATAQRVEDYDGNVGANTCAEGLLSYMARHSTPKSALSEGSATVKSISAMLAAEEGVKKEEKLQLPDVNFLSGEEATHLVHQYLSRSIPTVVSKLGGIVTTRLSSGDVFQSLVKGCAALEEREGKVPVIGLVGDEREDHDHIITRYKDFTHLVMLSKENGEKPNTFDISTYSTKWLSELRHRDRFTEDDKHIPRRNGVSCVVVLFGGYPSAKYELLPLVLQGFTIFVIEGTGGLADAIIRTKNIMLEKNAMAGEGQYSGARFLSAIDSTIAEIVARGKCVIVPRGEVVDSFTSSLSCGFKGDETLRMAWEKYTLWSRTSSMYRILFIVNMVSLLFVGLVAVLLPVMQSFLQVQFPAEVDGHGDPNSKIRIAHQIMTALIIFLPILQQLLQVITNRTNAGHKWCLLHWAKEHTLGEIYSFRMEVGDYSAAAVARAKIRARQQYKEVNKAAPVGGEDAGADAGAKEGGGGGDAHVEDGGQGSGESTGSGPSETYSTRQELLYQRLQKFSAQIMGSDIVLRSLDEDEIFPPKHIRERGDNGFISLSPDEYVEMRLQPKIVEYTVATARISLLYSSLTWMMHFFNTAGTLLAALATQQMFAEYNLQACVAFTTAFVSALDRFADWMMLEWMQAKYNTTMMSLTNVISWWTSRGARQGQNNVHDELVRSTESHIAAEVDEFRKQQHASQTKVQEDMESVVGDLEKEIGSEGDAIMRKAVAKVKDLNLGVITPEAIQRAMDDPEGAAAVALQKVIVDVNKELGDPIKRAKDSAVARLKSHPDLRDIKQIVTTMQSGLSTVTNSVGSLDLPEWMGKLNFRAAFPTKVLLLIVDERQTSHFVHAMVDDAVVGGYTTLTKAQLVTLCGKIDLTLQEEVKLMPIRLVIEFMTTALLFDRRSRFVDAVQGLGVSLVEIGTHDKYGEIMEELRRAAFLPESLPYDQCLSFIVNPNIRARIGALLTSSKFRQVLRRCRSVFFDSSPENLMLRDLLMDAARMDLHNYFFSTPADRISLMVAASTLVDAQFPTSLLPRATLEEIFKSKEHLSLVQHVHQPLLAQYVEWLRRKMPFARAYHRFLRSIPLVNTPINTTERKEQFGMILKTTTQEAIFRMGKPQILRLLASSTYIDRRFVEDFRRMPEREMITFMSTFKARVAKTYCSEVFDAVGEEVTVDLSAFLEDFELRVLFLRQLREFSGVEMKSAGVKEMIALCGFHKLSDCLDRIHDYHISEIVERLRQLLAISFVVPAFNHAVTQVAEKMGIKLDGVMSWTVQDVDKFVMTAVHFEDMDGICDDDDVHDILRVSPIPKNAVITLAHEVKRMCGKPACIRLFRSISRDILNPDVNAKFDATFSASIVSQAFTNLFYVLLKHAPERLANFTSYLASFPSPDAMLEAACSLLETHGDPAVDMSPHTFVDVLSHVRTVFCGDAPGQEASPAEHAAYAQEESIFSDICIHIGSRAIYDSPLILFHVLANRLTTFALTAVVEGVECRTKFVLLLHRIVAQESVTPLFAEIDDAREILSGLVPPTPTIASRITHIITDLVSDMPTFRSLLSEIRQIPATFMCAALVEFYSILYPTDCRAAGTPVATSPVDATAAEAADFAAAQLSSDPLIRLFDMAYRIVWSWTDPKQPNQDRRLATRQREFFIGILACTALSNMQRVDPEGVDTAFDSFSLKSFSARTIEDRQSTINKYISTDILGTQVSGLSDKAMGGLFTYMRHHVLTIRVIPERRNTTTMSDTQRRRKAMFSLTRAVSKEAGM